jgi:hypothetical protein
MKSWSGTKKAMAGGALVLVGFGVGAAVAVTGAASAAPDAPDANGVHEGARSLDPSKSLRSDEKLLTGTTADKVRAAALAKYPKATIQRVETDSEGVYEAHVVTADGRQVTVQVGKDFTVTGTREGPGRGGPGGFHGDRDGDGDHGDGPPAGSAEGSAT